jgi:DNA-binding XRE family transcriptional regulator
MRKNPNFKLKALRLEYNLKQADLAKLLGMGETTYNRKENGITEFTESEMKKVCNIFGKKPDEIFFRDDVTKNITKEVG